MFLAWKICYYSPILHALSHSQWHVLGLLCNLFYKRSNHLILYSHIDVYHDSIFALNYSHLHSHDSCWTKNLVSFFSNIKLNIFTFRFFTLLETDIQAYGSSIVLKTSTTLINTDSRLTIKRFIIVYINKGWSRLT